MIANLCTPEYLLRHVSLPGINRSTGSLVFHELLTLPGTAIGTKNTVVHLPISKSTQVTACPL